MKLDKMSLIIGCSSSFSYSYDKQKLGKDIRHDVMFLICLYFFTWMSDFSVFL